MFRPIDDQNAMETRLCNQLYGHVEFLERLCKDQDLQSLFLISNPSGTTFLREATRNLMIEQASRTTELISLLIKQPESPLYSINKTFDFSFAPERRTNAIREVLSDENVEKTELKTLLIQESFIVEMLLKYYQNSLKSDHDLPVLQRAGIEKEIKTQYQSYINNEFTATKALLEKKIRNEVENEYLQKIQNHDDKIRGEYENKIANLQKQLLDASAQIPDIDQLRNQLRSEIETELKQQLKKESELSSQSDIQNDLSFGSFNTANFSIRAPSFTDASVHNTPSNSLNYEHIRNAFSLQIDAEIDAAKDAVAEAMSQQIEEKKQTLISEIEMLKQKLQNEFEQAKKNLEREYQERVDDAERRLQLNDEERHKQFQQKTAELQNRLKAEAMNEVLQNELPRERTRIEEEIRKKIEQEFQSRLKNEVESAQNQAEEKLRSSIESELRESIEKELSEVFGSKLQLEVSKQKRKLESELRESIEEEIRNEYDQQNEIFLEKKQQQIKNDMARKQQLELIKLREEIEDEVRAELTESDVSGARAKANLERQKRILKVEIEAQVQKEADDYINLMRKALEEQLRREYSRKSAAEIAKAKAQARDEAYEEMSSFQLKPNESDMRKRMERSQIEEELRNEINLKNASNEERMKRKLSVELEAKLRSQIEDELRGTLETEIRYQLRPTIERELANDFDMKKSQIEKELRDNINREYTSKLNLQRRMLEREIRQSVAEEMRYTLESELTAKIEGQLRPRIEAELRPKISESVEYELRPRIENELRSQIERENFSKKPSQREMQKIRKEIEAELRKEFAANEYSMVLDYEQSKREFERETRARIERELRHKYEREYPSRVRQSSFADKDKVREEVIGELEQEFSNYPSAASSPDVRRLAKHVEEAVKAGTNDSGLLRFELDRETSRLMAESEGISLTKLRPLFNIVCSALGTSTPPFTRDDFTSRVRQLARETIEVRNKLNAPSGPIIYAISELCETVNHFDQSSSQQRALLSRQASAISKLRSATAEEWNSWARQLYRKMTGKNFDSDNVVDLRSAITAEKCK